MARDTDVGATAGPEVNNEKGSESHFLQKGFITGGVQDLAVHTEPGVSQLLSLKVSLKFLRVAQGA